MQTRERMTLKRLADRLRTDSAFLRAVAADPARALATLGLRPAQVTAAGALALSLNGGLPVKSGGTTTNQFW